MDERQASIVFQSSLKVASEILLHNSKGGEVEPKAVVELALKLARIAYDPRPHMKRQEEKGDK